MAETLDILGSAVSLLIRATLNHKDSFPIREPLLLRYSLDREESLFFISLPIRTVTLD